MTPPLLTTFTGRVVPGVRRGRTLKVPTINLDLRDVPGDLPHGIYACFVQLGDEPDPLPAVMHLGPRPVFRDTPSCEVHLLDRSVPSPPGRLTVSVVEHLRDVTDFPVKEVLEEQMQADIAVARDILGVPQPHP